MLDISVLLNESHEFLEPYCFALLCFDLQCEAKTSHKKQRDANRRSATFSVGQPPSQQSPCHSKTGHIGIQLFNISTFRLVDFQLFIVFNMSTFQHFNFLLKTYQVQLPTSTFNVDFQLFNLFNISTFQLSLKDIIISTFNFNFQR